MKLERIKENWETIGEKDPLWGILTDPNKRGNKWNEKEFFQTGVSEIESTFAYIKQKNIEINSKKCLDFGCGVGRLTFPLGKYFDSVIGVDISSSMIKKANQYNQLENVEFICNQEGNLKLFEDNQFSVIYSKIVLQHINPRNSRKYIKEFIRILQPGGILIFQLPHKSNNIKYRIKSYIFKNSPEFLKRKYIKYRTGSEYYFDMYAIKKKKVVKFLQSLNTSILDIRERSNERWVSVDYIVKKP